MSTGNPADNHDLVSRRRRRRRRRKRRRNRRRRRRRRNRRMMMKGERNETLIHAKSCETWTVHCTCRQTMQSILALTLHQTATLQTTVSLVVPPPHCNSHAYACIQSKHTSCVFTHNHTHKQINVFHKTKFMIGYYGMQAMNMIHSP